MKRCRDCGQCKPLDRFAPHPETRDGRNSYCYDCQNVRTKAWREKNRERAKLHQQRYQERVKGLPQRRYEEAHSVEQSRRCSEWKKANPHKVREYFHRRHAWMLGNESEPVDFDAIIARDGRVCQICGREIGTKEVLHFDHVVPLSKGGGHTASNIKPAHARCNLRKNNREDYVADHIS